jgi:hypothetical protein
MFSPFGVKFWCRVAGTQPDFRGDFDHVSPVKRRGFWNSELTFLYFLFSFASCVFLFLPCGLVV